MSKHEPEPTVRFHSVLFKDDLDWLRETYGKKLMSWAVRKIIRSFRTQIEAKANQGAAHLANDGVLDDLAAELDAAKSDPGRETE